MLSEVPKTKKEKKKEKKKIKWKRKIQKSEQNAGLIIPGELVAETLK